jgi:S1-C subfamily serine protease
MMETARAGVSRRTVILFVGLVVLVGLIVWPSFLGRIRYAQTRAELRAIRDAAMVAELSSVGKLFTTLARVIGPSVVNVTSVRRVTTLIDEIAALHGGLPGGQVDETVGSGLIISADGYIATNYHVVAQSETIEVKLADDRTFPARLVGADAATDLAVLQIDADELPAADWGDSDGIEVGEMVWAIGNPYGLDRTLTYGIISGVGRRGVVGNPYEEFLQTDASINPGNSGGPLVDVHGRVMGITTAIVGRSFRGIGFAIPSNTARRICVEIQENGYVERGHVGLQLREHPGGGVLVVAVAEQSPAALAGLQAGDVIEALGDERIDSPATLVLMLTRLPIGEDVVVTVRREGSLITVPVRIGRRPRERGQFSLE